MSSMSDILLTFLSDGKQDNWSDHFQFPDCDVDDMSEFARLLESVPEEPILSPQDPFFEIEHQQPAEYAFPDHSFASDSDEDSMCASTNSYGYDPHIRFAEDSQLQFATDSAQSNNESVKTVDFRISTADAAMKPKRIRKSRAKAGHKIVIKEKKLTAEQKVVNLVKHLKRLKRSLRIIYPLTSTVVALTTDNPVKSESEPPELMGVEVRKEKLDITQMFLNSLLSSKSSAVQELSECCSPFATLHSQSISSLYAQTSKKRANLNLCAWAPLSTQGFPVSLPAFPEKHVGIGQVSGAARGFASCLADIIPRQALQQLTFSVELDKNTAILSDDYKQVAAPFSWRSCGLKQLGFVSEMECHGLIRGSFDGDVFSNVNVSFDSFALVHQCVSL